MVYYPVNDNVSSISLPYMLYTIDTIDWYFEVSKTVFNMQIWTEFLCALLISHISFGIVKNLLSIPQSCTYQA